MMPGMLVRVPSCALASSMLLVACAGIAPDPRAADAATLPSVELTTEQREAVQRDESRAILAISRQRYDEARRLAELVLDTQPRSARARAVIGLTMLERAAQQRPTTWRGLREGETQLELASQLAPGDATVAWLHAIFLAEIGHLSAAAARAEEGLAAAAEAPLADRAVLLGAAGNYRYELGEERAALPHLQAYIALRSDDAEAVFRIGWCLLRRAEVPRGADALRTAQVDAESAAKAFLRCSELRQEDESAALAVVTSYLRAAQLADERGERAARDSLRAAAGQHLRRMAERFPKSAEVRFHMGLLAEAEQQPDVARAAYGAALELSPAHLGSALNLAALLQAAGDPGGAETVLRRLLDDARAAAALTREERRRVENWLADRSAPTGG